MMYLMSQLWPWLLVALFIGMIVGWITCADEPTRWWTGWVPFGLAVFMVGIVIALFQMLPGRSGLMLDSALLMFASYILGCVLGCMFRQRLTGRDGLALAGHAGEGHSSSGHSDSGRKGSDHSAAGHAAPGRGQTGQAGAATAAHSATMAREAATGAAAWASTAGTAANARAAGATSTTASTADAGTKSSSSTGNASTGVGGAGDASAETAAASASATGSNSAATAGDATAAANGATGTASAGASAATANATAAAADLPPEPQLDNVPANLPGSRPRGYVTALAGKGDDLKRIRGIGKQNEGRLHALGIWHFSQISAWTREEIDWVSSYLAFPGRIDREDWVSQARLLASGAETEFSQRVARGEVASSKDSGDAGQTNIADLPEGEPKPKG